MTSVFRKKTFSGLMQNFTSFAPFAYKIGLIITLTDRVYKICKNRASFDTEIKKVKQFLCKNLYPPQLIDKTVKKYLDAKTAVSANSEENDCKSTSYFKVPYIGLHSKIAQKQINTLCNKFCKNIDIKLAFTSSKVSSYFSTKDKMPNNLRSCVVYQFNCAFCNKSYVGETTRHYNTRVAEHLFKKSQPTSVKKHLNANLRCEQACNEACFEILDQDDSEFRLKVKEAIHNQWVKPTINKQKELLKMSILI